MNILLALLRINKNEINSSIRGTEIFDMVRKYIAYIREGKSDMVDSAAYTRLIAKVFTISTTGSINCNTTFNATRDRRIRWRFKDMRKMNGHCELWVSRSFVTILPDGTVITWRKSNLTQKTDTFSPTP